MKNSFRYEDEMPSRRPPKYHTNHIKRELDWMSILDQYRETLEHDSGLKPKSVETYKENIKPFFAWMAKENIINPTEENIVQYREYLNTHHVSIRYDEDEMDGYSIRKAGTHSSDRGKTSGIQFTSNTQAQYLEAVRRFFNWTDESGIYPNIAKKIRPINTSKKHRKSALSKEEYRKLHEGLQMDEESSCKAFQEDPDQNVLLQRLCSCRRIRAIIELSVNAGLRTIELERLDTDSFLQKRGVRFVRIQGKGRDTPDEEMSIADDVFEMVKEYMETLELYKKRMGYIQKDDDYERPLFVGLSNNSMFTRLPARTISTMIKTAMKQVGIDDRAVTAHSLRHTTATQVMAISGGNIYQAQQVLRHSDVKTTQVYIESLRDDKKGEIASNLYKTLASDQAGSSRKELSMLLDNCPDDKIDAVLKVVKAMMGPH